jgi:RNA polymerase sigma-70 factor, ECF subfamily
MRLAHVNDQSTLVKSIRRAREGENGALAELFEFYRDHLRRMVCFRFDHRLASRVSPSDVIQEAYIDAAKRLSHFDGHDPTAFFVWIRQITGQTMVDIHRRHIAYQNRDVRREAAAHPTNPSQSTAWCITARLFSQTSSPSMKAQRSEMEDLLKQGISRMDPIDREVLALRHFEELTNNEVARVLGLKPTAATNRYFRAIQRLKKIMDHLRDSCVLSKK